MFPSCENYSVCVWGLSNVDLEDSRGRAPRKHHCCRVCWLFPLSELFMQPSGHLFVWSLLSPSRLAHLLCHIGVSVSSSCGNWFCTISCACLQYRRLCTKACIMFFLVLLAWKMYHIWVKYMLEKWMWISFYCFCKAHTENHYYNCCTIHEGALNHLFISC